MPERQEDGAYDPNQGYHLSIHQGDPLTSDYEGWHDSLTSIRDKLCHWEFEHKEEIESE
jgi:hypothetical protein